MLALATLLLAFGQSILAEDSEVQKCYSCSSPRLHLRWPKSSENRLLYLRDFPHFANESCEQIRGSLPVVDCPNSVCIKAVIKEPPAKREACVEGGAIVRDCWSRVMSLFPYALKPPKTKKDHVRLIEPGESGEDVEATIGFIYTCKGYLCNGNTKISTILSNVLLLLLVFTKVFQM
ncbi:unnamed protein product, partial [Mesorhabditis belari]|uniref:Uncharacterized protein n=1 Tax=Mesorhabditis belari TaxID=2138241 RepID=A0AAF3F1I8_9BILA